MKISHLAAVISLIRGFQVWPVRLFWSGLGTAALLAAEAEPCRVTSEENVGQRMAFANVHSCVMTKGARLKMSKYKP